MQFPPSTACDKQKVPGTMTATTSCASSPCCSSKGLLGSPVGASHRRLHANHHHRRLAVGVQASTGKHGVHPFHSSPVLDSLLSNDGVMHWCQSASSCKAPFRFGRSVHKDLGDHAKVFRAVCKQVRADTACQDHISIALICLYLLACNPVMPLLTVGQSSFLQDRHILLC